jgi:cell division protein FtsQ
VAKRKQPDPEPEESSAETKPHWGWKFFLRLFGGFVVLMLVFFVYFWLEGNADRFLREDSRFMITPRTIDPADDPIQVKGLHRASRSSVLEVFRNDRGRSVYALDLERHRFRLRAVEWVRDASVRRIWPNRVEVEIFERVPVAFIRVASGTTGDFNNPIKFRPALIDEDGVILSPRGDMPQGLPLLSGIREDSDIEARHEQVVLMQQVLKALGKHRSGVVEVDVGRPTEIRIGYLVNGQTYNLILGEELFAERVELFQAEYDKMPAQFNAAKTYDLTNEGRIIAIDPAVPEQAKVVGGAKK